MPQADTATKLCPAPAVFDALLLGNLSESEFGSISGHVDGCADCQQHIEKLTAPTDQFIADLAAPCAGDPCEAEVECASAVTKAEMLADRLTTPAGNDFDSDRDFVRPGDRIGPYRLLEKIGAGGMGSVFKAKHTKLRRVVALKVVSPSRFHDAEAVARFEREMTAIGGLDHPNIVKPTDANDDRGIHYLVMEYMDGLDVSRLRRRLGQLPIAEACEIVRQTAIGLQYAHEHGVVHRDVKPSNLMLAVSDRHSAVGHSQSAIRNPNSAIVKILDLGLAQLAPGLLDVYDGLTSTDQFMGTIDYAAPEQLASTRAVDIRADIYSLGATLYKLLTGEAPFAAPHESQAQKIAERLRDEPPSIAARRSDLPKQLVTVVDRMLARHPGDRFQTPGDVALALDEFCTGANLLRLVESAQTSRAAPNIPAFDEGATDQPSPTGNRLFRHKRAFMAACIAITSVAAIVALPLLKDDDSSTPDRQTAKPAASPSEDGRRTDDPQRPPPVVSVRASLDDSGNLIVEDTADAGTSLRFLTDGDRLRIVAHNKFQSGGGPLVRIDEHTVELSLALIGGTPGITVKTGGGDDTVTFDSAFDPGDRIGVQFDTGDGVDRVVWQSTATLAAVEISAESIHLTSGSITTLGNQTYHGHVLLGQHTTLAGADITFNGPVGNQTPPSILATDYLTNCVHRFDVTGKPVGIFAAELASPAGIAVDSEGNVFVAETGAECVRKFDPSGVSQGAVVSGFVRLNGIAIDSQDHLYTVEQGEFNLVQKFDTSGKRLATITRGKRSPYDVAVDKDDNLYVAYFGGAIEKFDPRGKSLSDFVTAARGAIGMAFDRQGNLYVACHDDEIVQKFDRSGSLVATAPGTKLGVMGVLIDKNDVVLVCNSAVGTISKYDTWLKPLGEFTADMQSPRYATSWNPIVSLTIDARGETNFNGKVAANVLVK